MGAGGGLWVVGGKIVSFLFKSKRNDFCGSGRRLVGGGRDGRKAKRLGQDGPTDRTGQDRTGQTPNYRVGEL